MINDPRILFVLFLLSTEINLADLFANYQSPGLKVDPFELFEREQGKKKQLPGNNGKCRRILNALISLFLLLF